MLSYAMAWLGRDNDGNMIKKSRGKMFETKKKKKKKKKMQNVRNTDLRAKKT